MAQMTRAMGFAILLPLTALPAPAAEYCVTCAAPAAMYRCVIKDTPDGPGSNPSEQLACISELAKAGNHETCTASKSAPFPCPGETRTVTASPDVLPTLQGTTAEPAAEGPLTPADGAEPPQPGDAPAGSNPAETKVPRTVEELAGQTVQSTKEGLKKAGEAVGETATKAGEKIGTAGEAVGSAAQKSWKCITSLFSDCFADETPP